MDKINDNILNIILNFIHKSLWIDIIFLNKYMYKCKSKEIKEFINNKIKIIKSNIPNKIIYLLNGYNFILKIPILKWKNNFSSNYDRPNNINLNDIMYPIMFSFDAKQRMFFIIKKKKSIYLLFKKYFSDKYTWEFAPIINNEIGYTNFILVNNYFYDYKNSKINIKKFKEYIKSIRIE